MIGFYIHHVGGGHLARATRIARELHGAVTGLSSAPRPADWPGLWVTLPRDDDPDDRTAEPAADARAGGVLHFAPLRDGFRRRQAAIATWLSTSSATVLVADVSVEVTALARLLGVPVVVMAMPGAREDAPHRLGYDLAARIIAPWPPGAHPQPLSWSDRAAYVGGISRFAGPPGGLRTPRTGLLLWGRGGEAIDERRWETVTSARPDWQWTLAADLPPARLWAHLQSSAVVVTHGGQGSVADVATAEAPAVVVAEPRPHDEQLATVRALARLGLAATAQSWPTRSEMAVLIEAAETVGGHRWSQWRCGGAAQAARCIETVAA